MECIGIEKEAYRLVKSKVDELMALGQSCNIDCDRIREGWIENRELARCLDVSLRMLQSLRERGIIGYSMIGKKIYYRIDDVKEVIENGKIISNIWRKKE